MLTRYLFILLFIAAAGMASGQSSEKKEEKRKAETSQSNSRNTSAYFPPVRFDAEKTRSRRSKGLTYDAEEKYAEQKEEIARQKRRAERELMKQKNTNPLYFGHKRPPKKRKAGKMKLCKVCGIMH